MSIAINTNILLRTIRRRTLPCGATISSVMILFACARGECEPCEPSFDDQLGVSTTEDPNLGYDATKPRKGSHAQCGAGLTCSRFRVPTDISSNEQVLGVAQGQTEVWLCATPTTDKCGAVTVSRDGR